jgi:uncharacterized protein YjdB
VSPATASVVLGATQALTATTKDANGNVLTGRVVTWTSSATAVATVSTSGVVTGVATGTATITATSEGKTSNPSTITVTPVPVGTVTVAPSTNSIFVQQTAQLTATVKDLNGVVVTDRVVTWSSNNPAFVSVSSSGVVTGLIPGSATITATSEGKSGSASVNVTLAPVATVTVTPPTASVIQGQTQALSATLKDALGNTLTGRTITWTTSAPSFATVSSSGVVTAVAVGSATITATSEGKTGTATITVTPIPVATVTVSPASTSVKKGDTKTLSATTRDANGNVLTGRVVTWSSSDTSKATVSSTGVVTGVAAGSVVITATSEGKSGTSTVTVTP